MNNVRKGFLINLILLFLFLNVVNAFESVTDTLNEGETKTYNLDGKNYTVTVTAITDTGIIYAKFNINGEPTKSLKNGESVTLLDGATLTVTDIIPNEAGDVTQDLVEFTLSTPEDIVINNFRDYVVDQDSDTFYDYLVIEFNLTINESGEYEIWGRLYDSLGNRISGKEYDSFLEVGTHSIPLYFSGAGIYYGGVNGPYFLKNLAIENDDILEYQDVYNTSFYDYTEFQKPYISLTGYLSDYGVDTDDDGFYSFLTINVGINITRPGYYSISGELYDISDDYVIGFHYFGYLDVGVHTIQFNYSGVEINLHGVNGPFLLKRIWLYDNEEDLELEYHVLYNTSAYDYTDFQGPGAKFNQDYSDYGLDNNGDGLYDYLVIEVGLNVTKAGNYEIDGRLEDSFGDRIVYSKDFQSYLDVGVYTIPLNFSGMAIYKNGVNGPYSLERLYLYDRDNRIRLESLDGIYNTSYYNYIDFERLGLEVTGNFTDYGIDVDSDGLYDYLTIEVPINVTVEGYYQIEAEMDDIDAEIDTAVYLNLGDKFIYLNSPGFSFYNSGQNGPYILEWFEIEYDFEIYEMWDEYYTNFYNYTDFEQEITIGCIDNDKDGFNQSQEGCGVHDCNDNNASIHPGAEELCNGVDDNCDGLIDNDCITEWEPVRTGVLVEFPNGTIYKKCLNVTNKTNGYELMQQTDLELLWSPETPYGHMLCKINGVGGNVSGQYCEYSGSFWNILLNLNRDESWLYSPVGFDAPGDCWNRDINLWEGHYCAKEGDVLGFAYGPFNSSPTYHTFSEICGCVEPYDGMVITEDTTFCPGTYNLPNGIEIGADGVVLDCSGAILEGDNENGIYVINYEFVTIKNCVLKEYDDGIILVESDHNTIINNQVINHISRGFYCDQSNHNFFLNNTGIGNDVGLLLRWNSNNNTIVNNSFILGDVGVLLYHESNNNTVTNNKLINNSYGLYIEVENHNAKISRNEIIGNEYGIYSRYPTLPNTDISIEYNNIISNKYNLFCNQSKNITAKNNYWGTTDINEIQNKIYDYYDDDSLGIVDFCPYLDAPWPDGEAVECKSVELNQITFDGVTLDDDLIFETTRGDHLVSIEVTAYDSFENVELELEVTGYNRIDIENDTDDFDMNPYTTYVKQLTLSFPLNMSGGSYSLKAKGIDAYSTLFMKHYPLWIIEQCDDNLDNDNDGLIDREDPGCWNADGSYNRSLDDESVAGEEDIIPPNITILSPINGSTIKTSSTLLNVTTDEDARCWYRDYNYPSNDTTPPSILDHTPIANIPLDTVVTYYLGVRTDGPAICRGSLNVDLPFDEMDIEFNNDLPVKTDLGHSFKMNFTELMDYAVFVKCKDLAGNIMKESYNWNFSTFYPEEGKGYPDPQPYTFARGGFKANPDPNYKRVHSFELKNLKNNYIYSIDVLCEDKDSNSDVGLVIFYVNLTKKDIPIANTFDGNTTDFSSLNETELANISNVVLEKKAYGKIDFGSSVLDLSNNPDLDSYVAITNGVVAIDTNNLPALNVSATITMYNLPYSTTPVIYYNGGFTTDPSGFTIPCPTDICSNINYNPSTGTLIFDVAHFSSFGTGSEETPPSPPPAVIGTNLTISDLDVKVGGETEKDLKDGDKIGEEARPGDKVKFDIEIENTFSKSSDIEIEDITVTVTIKDIDDGDDLEEDADIKDIDAGKNEDVSIEFTIPTLVDKGEYDVIIEVDGEDENRNDHEIRWELTLEVKKDKHALIIDKASLSPSTIRCNRNPALDIEVINIGREDEEDVKIEIKNVELGIDIEQTDIELEEGNDEDSVFEKTYRLEIDDNVKAATYPISIKAYYDNELGDEEKLDLIVEKCVEEVITPVETEPVEIITETPTITKPVEPPVTEISFTDTSGFIAILLSLFVILSGLVIFAFGYVIIMFRK